MRSLSAALSQRSHMGPPSEHRPDLGPCRIWTGAKDRHGYGHMKVNGRYVPVHRLVYEDTVGPVPAGLQLDHLCRVRACVEVAHLEPVTSRENTLRGTSIAAKWARRDRCGSGHLFTPENTRTRTDGGRACRECSRIRNRSRRAARAAARLALVVAALALTLTAAPPSSAEPRPNPCYDYLDLEAGRAAPARQDVFNHLDARGYARWRMACVYGWGGAQFDCLDRLWTAESSWNHHADGAADTWGIPQAYPGRKMATFGADWRDNPRTQVKWGLEYLRDRYTTPTGTGCTAGY